MMETKTGRILKVLKVLALIAGIGFSIECGSQLLTLAAGFINPDWATRTYGANPEILSLRANSDWYFINAMSFLIVLSGVKALVWYRIMDLLLKLKLKTPFSMEVAKKLENISYLLLSVWVISIIATEYMTRLAKATGKPLTGLNIGGEYLFIAGIVYIISKIFNRGIELQEENQLTV